MSNFKFFFIVLLWIIGFSGMNGQNGEETLFSVANTPVKVSEFLTVFQKNYNNKKSTPQTKKDVEDYLKLYVNFKLKLQDAYDKGLDKDPAFLKEYSAHKNQLIKPYLRDEETEKALIDEAYQRMQEEVKASHILIRLPKYPKPQDTLKAYNTILELKSRINKGEDFNSIARAHSQDPSAKNNGGHLGYFSAFKMVYPFENAAYNTPTGQVSNPVRTQFGYHLLKIEDRRPSRGEVEVAHIMLRGDYDKNKPVIEDLKRRIDEGADFFELAKSYSHDKGSSGKGGRLPKFGAGRMIEDFENVAFSLNQIGDVSEPFKTKYGWHIVKLLKKYPLGSLDELRADILKKINKDNRGNQTGHKIVERLLRTYKFQPNSNLLSAFAQSGWETNSDLKSDETILIINDKKYPVKDFYNFYRAQINMGHTDAFNKYKALRSLDYYKEMLPETDQSLKDMLDVYEHGILIYMQMQNNVWQKAQKDSLGLKKYYNAHRDLYTMPKSATLIIVNYKGDDKLILEQLKVAAKTEDFTPLIKNPQVTSVRDQRVNQERSGLPKELRLKVGAYAIAQDNSFKEIYFVNDVEASQQVPLSKIRGKVLADYQKVLENDWMNELKQKYPVTINQAVLNTLTSKFKD